MKKFGKARGLCYEHDTKEDSMNEAQTRPALLVGIKVLDFANDANGSVQVC
jgi:hypothetical protein